MSDATANSILLSTPLKEYAAFKFPNLSVVKVAPSTTPSWEFEDSSFACPLNG